MMNMKYEFFIAGRTRNKDNILKICDIFDKYNITYYCFLNNDDTMNSFGSEDQDVEENMAFLQNGKVLELNPEEAKFTGNVTVGKVMVDGLGVGDVGNIVLRDRQHLSSDGLIIIVLTMASGTGEVVAGPDVISRGFVYVRESENLMDEVKQMLTDLVADCTQGERRDWASIKNIIKENLRTYIYQKTKRNPMILPIIMEV